MAANAMVMVVDDDEKLRGWSARSSLARGTTSLTAADGEEALGLLGEKSPDLVVTGPEHAADGRRAARRGSAQARPHAAADRPHRAGTVDKAVELMQKGACDFLTKPFSTEQLTGR